MTLIITILTFFPILTRGLLLCAQMEPQIRDVLLIFLQVFLQLFVATEPLPVHQS